MYRLRRIPLPCLRCMYQLRGMYRLRRIPLPCLRCMYQLRCMHQLRRISLPCVHEPIASCPYLPCLP